MAISGSIADRYGMEEEITIQPKTGADIINHETVLQAAQDGLNAMAKEADVNPVEKLEQVVLVLEQLSGSVNGMIREAESSQMPIELPVDEINETLIKNGMEPVAGDVTLSLAKEGIGQKIKDILNRIWETIKRATNAVINFFKNIFNKIFRSGAAEKEYGEDREFDKMAMQNAGELKEVTIVDDGKDVKSIFCDLVTACGQTEYYSNHIISSHTEYLSKIKAFADGWKTKWAMIDALAGDFEEEMIKTINEAIHHPNIALETFLKQAPASEQENEYFTLYESAEPYLGYVTVRGLKGNNKPISRLGDAAGFLGNHVKKSELHFEENPDNQPFKHEMTGYSDWKTLETARIKLFSAIKKYNFAMNKLPNTPTAVVPDSVVARFDDICLNHGHLATVVQKAGILMMCDQHKVWTTLMKFNRYQMHVMKEVTKFKKKWKAAAMKHQKDQQTLAA